MSQVDLDSRAFRNALSKFATGVTVITTVIHDKVHGMTANAFTSVSLDPPLILVSVSKHARMHAYLLEARRHGVSVLSEEQEPFAWHFAGRPREGLETPLVWKREVPVLANALAHLLCTVEACYPGGDHTLFLSRVEDLWYRDGSPLAFSRGRFFGLVPRPAGSWAETEEIVLDRDDRLSEPESPVEPWW